MVFVFDLDDTVCETDKYSEYYIKKFFNDNNLPYKQVAQNVRFAEMKFDWDHDTALKWYKIYGDKMMYEFPCKEGAVEFINSLYDAGHEIIIATARANDWHTDPEGITISWLKKVGIKYTKLYVGRFDKEKICEIEDADFFIDDDIKICDRVREFFSTQKGDKKVYLSTTDYNRELTVNDKIKRFENYSVLKESVNKYVNNGIML